ncbi:hypothetical protein HYALB_00009967 [Hymenoscyphus albidus]|uniref:Uncharacterized protein n=1 Tax=Hymenoscyphus albidus TaxID=595503 RepID=A0A9N9LZ32_9HELO|nr:hypothetical protein HYALB_00009967 [Hymenoscyphus albidus]
MKFAITVVLATALLTTSVPAIVVPRGGGEGGDPPKDFTPIKPATTARVAPGPYKPPFETKQANAKASKRSEKEILCDEGGCYTVSVPRTFPPIPQPTKTASVATQPYVPPFATKVKRADEASVTDSADAPVNTEFIKKREEGGEPPKQFTPIKPVTTAHQGGQSYYTKSAFRAQSKESEAKSDNPLSRNQSPTPTPATAPASKLEAFHHSALPGGGPRDHPVYVRPSRPCVSTTSESFPAKAFPPSPSNPSHLYFLRASTLAAPNQHLHRATAKGLDIDLHSSFMATGYSPSNSSAWRSPSSSLARPPKLNFAFPRGILDRFDNEFKNDFPFLIEDLEFVDVFDLKEGGGPVDLHMRQKGYWRNKSPEPGPYSKNPNARAPSRYVYCSKITGDLKNRRFPNVNDFARAINRYYGRIPMFIFRLIGAEGHDIINSVLSDPKNSLMMEQVTTAWWQLVDDVVVLLRNSYEQFLKRPDTISQRKRKSTHSSVFRRNPRRRQLYPSPTPRSSSVGSSTTPIANQLARQIPGNPLAVQTRAVTYKAISIPAPALPVENVPQLDNSSHLDTISQLLSNSEQISGIARQLKNVSEQLEKAPSAESLRRSLVELMEFASGDFLAEAERQREQSLVNLTAQSKDLTRQLLAYVLP